MDIGFEENMETSPEYHTQPLQSDNRHCDVCRVAGFSCAKMLNVNVMKAELLSILIDEDPASEVESDAMKFTMKRNSSMACFNSAHLMFVAPGSNYAGYLKAFGVVESKGFFPYQWVN